MQCYYPACQKKLTSTVDNVSCPYCRTYVYCSPTCRQLHWDISHKISCTGYATPNSNVIPSTSALDTSNASSDSRKKQKSVEDFEVINQPSKSNPDLGKGSFGQVKLVRDKTEPNKQYAMKVINKKQLMQFSGIDYLKREIKIQKKLDHPHIVKLFHYFEDKDNVYLILEYAKNGNLFFYLRKKKTLTEKEAFIYFFQTCVGIDYLHKKGILHRDLKPENLLLDASGNIKVCDFGWSAEDVGKRNTFCGTVDYMAPEMVQNKAHDFKIDIWSLGVLLFELLHGYPPFRGKTANEKFQSILEKEIKFKDGLSSEVKDLITNLLRSEPSMRPGFDYIFNHAWIQKNEKEFGMSVKNFIYDPTKKKEKDKSKGERSPSPISQPAVPTSNAPIGQPMTPTSSNMGLPLSIDPKIANPPGQYSTVSPRTDYKAQPTSPMGNNPFPTTGFSDLKTTSSPYSSMSQIPTSPARSRNNLEDPFAQPGKTDSPSKGLNKAQELVQSIFTPARDKSKSPPRSGIFSPHKQYDAPVTGKGLVDDILNKRKTTHENPIGNLAGVDFDASKRKTTNDISTIGQIDRTNRFGLDYAAQPSSMNNISGPFTQKETSPFPKVERSNSDNAIAFKPAGPIQGYPLAGTHSKSPSRDLSDLTKSAYASKVDPNVLKKDVDDDVPDIKESTKKENLQFGNNLTKSPNATSQAQERNFNPFGATTPSGISTDLSKSPKANVQASPYTDYSQAGYSHVSPKVQTQAPGGYLLSETNKPITPTGSGDKSLNKANDFLHPDVHKMISPSNATAGNYSANKFVQPQPSGKDLSINTSSNVYQASDYGQTPKSPGRVFESKPVVAPQNYTSTQPQSYHADPYKQQQTDYTYKESPQTKAADPYKQQQGDYMYKEPPQAKVTDERAAEKAKRAEYEERNQHKVPETRPKMEAQGDFFVPQGNDIDSLLKKYDTPATSGQFADGVKGFESDPVRFTRVTNLLQKGHLSEVDQILEKMTHNEEKGHVDNDRGRKVQEQKPGHQGRDRSPHGETEFRVTNIDKYLASYDIENTEENQILDMLDTYYTTGKMEDDGNQRYPKKQANETKPVQKTNVDESIGEMSFQVDAPQKGYEDNSSRKLRNEMSFQEGDSRYDDRNQGQRQAKTEMSFADMSQDGEESPLYEKSRGQRTGQKTPEHIEETHEHEEEDDYYEQKTRGKKGMESDVNKRRQQEQQKPVQNNYQHEESEEEQREQRYRREEARNRGKENQKSQETKGGKKGRVSSEEEEKQRMGYEKERGVKNEDRRGKDVSPGGYDKKIKEEAGSFIVRMVEKERSEPTMNRPKGGYEGNVGVKRGNLQQKEGGRNMESQREDLIKQYRNKMNGLYSFNSESTLTMKEENESHYQYEEPVNQEYAYRNEKGFAKEDGNREQRRNKKVEDEYEDDHDNGYGRRYNDRKEERNPYEKDNRQKPKKKKNEWERGYGEDSYEEHDANYYKQKLLMTNPKSMTESYDDMIKRKQRLEYYMDDLDLDDSRTVSRPSWKNIREIPKYQEEEPKNETLLGKISSLFGCLDRSEKKPQQKTRKGRKV